MNTKLFGFKLYDFNCKPKAFYTVKTEAIIADNNSSAKVNVGHSIIVVDRSGSMWQDIANMKSMLIKLLTIEEYKNSSMLVSLISYSTQGDCSIHFQRVPVQDIMKTNSPQQAAIHRIQSSGLTCISQAMLTAKELIRSDEATAIVLHSDGYANDPSVLTEHKNMALICNSFRGQNVFVNTVAYRDASDFTFLSAIANATSGACIKANSVNEVYDVLHDSMGSVNQAVRPPIEVKTDGADYIVFVSKSKSRINGSDTGLTIAGLSPEDEGTVYRYFKSNDTFKEPVTENQHSDYVLAFARAKLADGRLNDAKFATYSFGLPSLYCHMKALTSPQLSEMANDLESILFGRACIDCCLPDKPLPLGGDVTVTGILNALETVKQDVMLNLKSLQEKYKLRGIKRIPGVRTDGKLEKPWLEEEFTDAGDWVPMGSFDFNRNSATVNLLITRPSRLVKVEDKKPISEVAGINVASLCSFRNYTIIGDGEVLVPQLKIKFKSQSSYDSFYRLCGLKAHEAFSSMSEYSINLEEFPVTSFNFDGDVSDMGKAYRDILSCKTLISILSAITKEQATEYTPEQIAELKRHYLSSSLNINFPTTTEYADLDEALKNGLVDTRVSYKVDIGDKDIINSGKLFSANEFLARHFIATGNARAGDKPNWNMFLDSNVSFQTKPPSAKMKLTAVDELCKPIFEEFLGLSVNGSVREVLKLVGIDKSVMDVVRGGVKTLDEIRQKIDKHLDKIYKERIMPFVFFVGATGLLPDCWDVKGLSAEELESQILGLKLGKNERDGTFFRVGDVVVSVYAKNEHFSTGRMV